MLALGGGAALAAGALWGYAPGWSLLLGAAALTICLFHVKGRRPLLISLAANAISTVVGLVLALV